MRFKIAVSPSGTANRMIANRICDINCRTKSCSLGSARRCKRSAIRSASSSRFKAPSIASECASWWSLFERLFAKFDKPLEYTPPFAAIDFIGRNVVESLPGVFEATQFLFFLRRHGLRLWQRHLRLLVRVHDLHPLLATLLLSRRHSSGLHGSSQERCSFFTFPFRPQPLKRRGNKKHDHHENRLEK